MTIRRRPIAVLVAVLALLAFAVAACGGSDSESGKAEKSESSESGAGAATKVYEPGASIATKVGDTFVVKVPATPSTGYEWTAAANAEVTFVSSKQVAGSSTLAGAPGTQELTFRATTPGASTLTLNYARSFDPAGTPPAKTETFPVTVTGSAKGASAGADYRDGDSITAAVGSTFTISLAATPSTGYEWTAAANPQVTFVSSTQITGSTVPGAAGTQVLTFRATTAGSSTLTVNYARSFDPAGTPPAKTVTFPVTVK